MGAGSDYDYATVKYNAVGTQVSAGRYNGPGNEQDYPHSLAVDASGNVYVTGYSDAIPGTSSFNMDYATVKYNKLGFFQWVRRYDGPSASQDVANALVLDAAGNVYVTGRCQNDPHWMDYTTIKYDATGVLKWLISYNGPGNNGDYARAMTIDASGNVYITGDSEGGGLTYADYATIKYSQPSGKKSAPLPVVVTKVLTETFQVSNYPNPVSATTRIKYEIPFDGRVAIKLYDVLGREVNTLVDEQKQAGHHFTEYNASALQKGIYYYRVSLKGKEKTETRSGEMTVIK